MNQIKKKISLSEEQVAQLLTGGTVMLCAGKENTKLKLSYDEKNNLVMHEIHDPEFSPNGSVSVNYAEKENCVSNLVGEPQFGIHPSSYPDDASNVLLEAQKIVNGKRQEDYGDRKQSFARIAKLWSSYLNIDVSSQDVVNMMILLKVSRAKTSFKRDNLIDIAGYAYCSELIHEHD